MRKQIAAANWKMNLTLQQAEKLMDELISIPHNLNENQEAVFGVPFPYLVSIINKLAGKNNAFVAAQNCYDKKSGAYTGEVSAEMLKSINVDYVILGHSERREYFNESHAMLAAKVNICLENGLKPIFCCGEPLSVREAGNENSYVETQLKESLFHLTAEQLTGFVIAYEPIWAIGTGKTASNEQAQQMHAHIRSVMAKQYGEAVADSISILYGGSVKANNAKEIFGQPDVDGGLVGGASLVAADFATIINSLK
ncbi:MAG: triose-phosphate isomerase [Ferruginibacter sp.]|nr:triose-phosphate isomerase [Ferruginibacter sp.]MBU9937030.1 triose-phosphate isomerase [Ferruginibacter sp.]